MTPSQTEQTYELEFGTEYYNPVTVKAVTAGVDENIIPENIREYVNILGVQGTLVERRPDISPRFVVSNPRGATFTAGSGYGSPNCFLNPTVHLNNIIADISPSTSIQQITISSGCGIGEVRVHPALGENFGVRSHYVKSGVQILGVTGSVVELLGEDVTYTFTNPQEVSHTFLPSEGKNGITSLTVSVNNENMTITPATYSQSIPPSAGYYSIGTATIKPVTADIDSNIKPWNIRQGITILGVTGTIDEGYKLPRSVSVRRVYGFYGTSFALPSNVVDIGYYAMQFAFDGCTSLTSVDLSSLTTISGNYAMPCAFRNCLGLTSVDLSSLTTISGDGAMQGTFDSCSGLTSVDLSSLTTTSGINAMQGAFNYCFNLTSVDLSSLTTTSGIYAMQGAFGSCTSLTSVDLSSLTTISGVYAMQSAFDSCISLTSVDLSSLTTMSGDSAMQGVFRNCSGLTSVDLSSLTTISGDSAMRSAFSNCTSLTSLSFPALTSTSFGSYTNQFNSMLSGVTGCTVHFPSNLQSVIGSWLDVTSGFGGTNTTVLFDLPATT